MTTENTISIPGIQPFLLKKAKKMRDRQLEEFDRQRLEKETAESNRIEESKQAFLDFLDKYACDILRRLDLSTELPVVESDSAGLWLYSFRVAHTVITLAAPENLHGGNCNVGVSVVGGYFGYAARKWIDKDNLSHYLFALIGEIVEQYQKYRFLVADLVRYNSDLKVAAQKTENDIASDKHSIWTWPDRANLNLYKIIWTKGGCCRSDTDSGWSLSDRPDDDGYFHLLTSTITRKLKVTPSAIELFSVTKSEDVPVELMVAICPEFDVAIAPEVSIRETQWSEEQVLSYKQVANDCDLDDLGSEDDIHIVFPEHLPNYHLAEYYSQIPDLVVHRTQSIELGRSPCLEIRLAVEAIASLSASVTGNLS
jgi:hypothetical protein